MIAPKMTFEQKKALFFNVVELCFLSAAIGFIAGVSFVALSV